MFCGNCGTENVNEANFCKECGKPLSKGAGQTTRMLPPHAGTAGVSGAEPKEGKVNAGQFIDKIKAVPKKILIGACAAVVAIIVIICVVINVGSTINLNDYLTVETNGYDGYGTAWASIDWDAIAAKYGNKISFTSQAINEYGGLINMMTPVEALQDYISVSLEETRELSNGEKIAYTWNVDENVSNLVKCKIKYKNDSYTVSGLTELETFDAFAGLEVEFSGISPNGNANINYTGSGLSTYDFYCDKVNGLSNGDTIVVSINEDRIEYYAENMGQVPEKLEQEYTVTGLSSYISTISEVNEAGLSLMQQQASDVFSAYIAQNWGDGEALENFTYIGNYLLTTKSSDSYWGNNNALYIVYKAQVRNDYSYDGDTYNKLNDLYWYICFENVMVDSDGNLTVDITNYRTPNDRFTVDSGVSNGWWNTQSWSYYGYQTLDDLYRKVVAANMDTYNHEDNIDESVAPEAAAIEETEITAETGYILPNSDKEPLTKADLEGLSAEECKIARNEIYARHGRKFKDEELQAYFNSCDWYEGRIEPDDFQESELSDLEIANKDVIVEYEEEKGYR